MTEEEAKTLNSGGQEKREQKNVVSNDSHESAVFNRDFFGLYDALPVFVLVFNSLGELIYNNNSLQKHLVDNNISDFFNLLNKEDAELIRNTCKDLYEKGEPKTLEVGLKFGLETRYYELRFNLMLPHGKDIIAVMNDISEIKKSALMWDIMYKITRISNLSVSLYELMEGAHSILKEYVQIKNLYLALYNKQVNTISFPYFIDENYPPEITSYPEQPWGKGATEYVIKKKEILHLQYDDLSTLVNKGDIQTFDYLPKSWLAIPVINMNDEVIGVLTTQHYNSDIDFSRNAKDLVVFIAAQIAGTIERLSVEKNLKKAEYEYKQIFDNNPDPLFIISDVYKNANSQGLKLFNCTLEELVGKTPADFSPKYQHDGQLSTAKQLSMINKAINDGYTEFVWKHQKLDGALIDCEVRINSITINKEKIILAWVRDVTEKMRAELVQKALYKVSESANSTANLQALFKAIHNIIQSLMPADNFYIALYNEVNNTLSFPYFVDEIDDPPEDGEVPFGRGLTEYIIRKGVDQIIDRKKDMELKALGETDLIGVPSASWMGIVLKIDEKIIGAMVLQDYNNPKAYNNKDLELLIFISEQIAQAIERKRFAEELAASKKLLEERANSLKQLNSTKDKFFSIIAHDLKSPFTALLGLSEYLAEDSDDLEPGEIVEYAQGIYNSAKNIYGLLENLLEWSRIQTGRFELIPTRFDIFKLSHSIVQLFHTNISKKQLEIIVKISPEQYVYADINTISTTLRNLLSNAIKFTRVGGKIEILGSLEGTMLRVKIKDNGVGISEETIKNLFRLDVQTSTLGTNNEKGTGIGLILCKEFVERNSGEFFVESTVGVGTTFSFTIPTMQ